MADNFELTLHSPLTKDDWTALGDYEHENNISVTFQTPKGKQVRYIKADILDKIRAEIEQKAYDWQEIDGEHENCRVVDLDDAFEVIDKYRQEV